MDPAAGPAPAVALGLAVPGFPGVGVLEGAAVVGELPEGTVLPEDPVLPEDTVLPEGTGVAVSVFTGLADVAVDGLVAPDG